MRVRTHIRLPVRSLHQSFRRLAPFAVSVTFHVSILLAMSMFSSSPGQPANRPEVEPPKKKFVLLYRPLPKLAPSLSMSRAEKSTAQALTRHQAVMVTQQPKPAPQFRLSPPPVLRDQTFSNADLIKIPLPAAAAPPEKAAPRAFVAPPAEKPKPKALLEVPTGEAPVLNSATSQQQQIKSAAIFSTKAVPKFQTQIGAAEKPPDLEGNDVSVKQPVIILNTSPGNLPPPPNPQVRQSGQLARAGELGRPAIRDTSLGEPRLPGVAVDPAKDPAKTPPSPKTTVDIERKPAPVPVREMTYQTSLLGGTENSVSIPLRPRSRSIPQDMERIFANRNAYTFVIPMTNSHGYANDWTMWFGEHAPTSEEGRVIAPLPRVKRIPLNRDPASLPAAEEVKVRIRAIVSPTGNITELNILACSNPALRTAVGEDLQQWEFRPARKAGVPFAAEVILEYRLKFSAATPSR